jgi:hypothetical protein
MVEKVYRGVAFLNAKSVASFLSMNVEDLAEGRQNIQLNSRVSGRESKAGVSSWSLDRAQAKSFSSSNFQLRCSVILCASIKDNPGMFLDMNDILSRVDVEQSLKREKEALALGPVLVESAEIVIA